MAEDQHANSGSNRGGRWRLGERMFAPVDIASIVVFRIGFGAILLWEVWRYFHNEWIDLLWIEPGFHFKYYGFAWVAPWPGHGMEIHLYVLGALALCIAIGLAYRACTVLFFLGFAYIFLLDQTTYLNHFYLVGLVSLLLIFVPAHRALSVDARWRPSIRAGATPAWTLWLLRFQIGIAYFYGGLAKLNGDWLRGEPMRGWLGERRDFPLIGSLFDREWMVYLFSYGGLLLDLAIVPLLLWRRTRVPAFVVAVVFHLTNSRLFDIGIFPWFMIVASTLFFPPDWPRRFLAGSLPSFRPAGPSRRGTLARLTTLLLCVYVLFQLLFPLRHWLYPGNVLWNEEGLRFAWYMKAYWKQPQVRFHVTDPAGGTTREIDALDYLTFYQLREMRRQPDMILQFSHHLSGELQREGEDRPAVHVRAAASLNGRRPQWIIDPAVDLAARERSMAHAPWIIPLTVPFSERMEEGDFEQLLGPSAIELARHAAKRSSAGQSAEALALMRDAVRIDPGNAALLGRLAEMLHRNGDVEQALAAYRRSLALDPHAVEVLVNLGKALAEGGELGQGIQLFRRALELSPGHAEAHYNLGLGLLMSGTPAESLEHLREAVRLRPGWIEPLNTAASVLATWNDPAIRNPGAALGLAEEAARLTNHENARVLDTLASVYAALGQFDLAVSTATRAIGRTGDPALAGAIERRLERYRQRRPFVQGLPAPARAKPG